MRCSDTASGQTEPYCRATLHAPMVACRRRSACGKSRWMHHVHRECDNGSRGEELPNLAPQGVAWLGVLTLFPVFRTAFRLLCPRCMQSTNQTSISLPQRFDSTRSVCLTRPLQEIPKVQLAALRLSGRKLDCECCALAWLACNANRAPVFAHYVKGTEQAHGCLDTRSLRVDSQIKELLELLRRNASSNISKLDTDIGLH